MTPSLQILLVEDDQDTRTLLKMVLEDHGHQVREADDGQAAVAAAASLLPDIAIVDLGLPDIDGYEVARRIRDLDGGQAVRLVALTGFSRFEDQLRAGQAGLHLYLVKPFDANRLARILGTPWRVA